MKLFIIFSIALLCIGVIYYFILRKYEIFNKIVDKKIIIIYYIGIYILIQIIQYLITGKIKIFRFLNEGELITFLLLFFYNSLSEPKRKIIIFFSLLLFVYIIDIIFDYYKIIN